MSNLATSSLMINSNLKSVILGWPGSSRKTKHISAPHLQETLGYTAPEYAIRGELSEKADIYNFGVLALEIISSRKNTDLSLSSEMRIFLNMHGGSMKDQR